MVSADTSRCLQRHVVPRRMMSSSRSLRSEASAGNQPGSAVGPMYRFQQSLPNLPVPSIASTATKYLDSLRPLLSDPSTSAPVTTADSPTAEFSTTKTAVAEFMESPLVAELQKRLEHRANEEGIQNWLADWWNDIAVSRTVGQA